MKLQENITLNEFLELLKTGKEKAEIKRVMYNDDIKGLVIDFN